MTKIRNIFILMGLFFFFIFRRWLLAYLLRLPRPQSNVAVRHHIRIPMSDGVMLVADHYYPTKQAVYPTILIRTPYGRNRKLSSMGWLLSFIAQRFAERGYHVVVQDVRGRFDSGGTFEPYLNEKPDGQATVAWIKRQPWFNGQIAMWGSSYLGLVQWALAADTPEIKAIAPTVTGSNMYRILYPDGVLDLGLAMRWASILERLEQLKPLPTIFAATMLHNMERDVQPAFDTVPVKDCDEVAIGHQVDFYQLWLQHPHDDDELWQEAFDSVNLPAVTVPVHLIGGWYDFFLRALLEDYQVLVAEGKTPYLTVGPWHHFNIAGSFVDVREGLAWFDAHLKGQADRLRAKPVRVYVLGAEEWRDLDIWPPVADETTYYLQPQGHLASQPAQVATAYTTYRYDPADPTPAVGGTVFGPGQGGRRDNRQLEARDDVLTFTTPAFTQALTMMGYVTAELYVRSTNTHTDFFAKVCDVYPDGRSVNICDGLVRLAPGRGEQQADGTLRVELDLWATAYQLKPGHRLRVQVSSGAHPRWMRNLGTGEDPVAASTMCSADQTIYHDVSHPSGVRLPIVRM